MRSNNGRGDLTSRSLDQIRGSTSDIVILFDPTDEITKNAAYLFNEFLKYEATLDLVPVRSMEDIDYAMSATKGNQLVIFLAHGLPKEFKLGDVYYEWTTFMLSLERSATQNFIVASCYSSDLETATDKNLKGIEGLMDYQAAVPILSFYALDYLYNIDGVKRMDTVEFLKGYFEQNKNDIIPRLITPMDPLGEVNPKKTLVYYSNQAFDNIEKLIDGLTGWIANNVIPVINSIKDMVMSAIPDLIADAMDALDMTIDTGQIGLGTDIFKAENDFLNLINGQFSSSVEISKELKLEKKIKLNDHLNLSFALELFDDKMVNGQTEYQYRGIGVRGTATLYTTDPFKVIIPTPGVNLIMDVKFKIQIGAEFLIKYESHDPNFDYNLDDISPNTQMYNEEGEIVSLLGYKKVKSLMEEDMTLEAWYGVPGIGIPPAFRVFGFIDLLLGFRIGTVVDQILTKIGHAEDKLKGSAAAIKDKDVEFSLARFSATGFFSSAGDGLLIQLNFVFERGPRLNIEIELKFVKIDIGGILAIRFPLAFTAKWDNTGFYWTKAEIYYPKIVFDIHLKIEIKFKVWGVTAKIEIGLGLDQTFYLPHGTLGAPKAGQTFNDYNAIKIFDINRDRKEDGNVVSSTSVLDDIFCPVIDNMIQSFELQTACESVGNAIFGHEHYVRPGTVADGKPPILEFMTPNSDRDDVLEYPEYGASTIGDILDNIDGMSIVNSLLEKIPTKQRTIEGFQNGSISFITEKAKPVLLHGDEAFVDIYGFDEHDELQKSSYVDIMNAVADFDIDDQASSIIPKDLTYTTLGEHTLQPFNSEMKMRAMLDVYTSQRDVTVRDDQGNVVQVFDFDLLGQGSTFARAQVWLPWTQTSYFTVDIDQNLGCSGCLEEFSVVYVRSIEAKYRAEYQTDINDTQNLSALDNGALHVTQFKNHVESGWGPADGISGSESIWRLELPLHKWYTQNLIPQSGRVHIYLKAWDNNGNMAKLDKIYSYEVPIDNIAPTITPANSDTQDADDPIDYHIATRGTGLFKYSFAEVMQQEDYYYAWGSGHSSYLIHSGLNATSINDGIALFRPDSEVITTTSSGIDNAFRYNIDLDVLNAPISFDIRASGNYKVQVGLQTTMGSMTLIYQYGVTQTYIDGQDIFMNTTEYRINGLQWSRVFAYPASILRSFQLDTNVTHISSITVRGSVEIDNIIVDGNLIMDGSSTSGWTVTDTNPTGYAIQSEMVYKPEQVDFSYSWSQIANSKTYDQEGTLMSVDYQLQFDTTQLADGEYFIKLDVYDNDYFPTSEIFRILVDNTSPDSFQIGSRIPTDKVGNQYQYTIQFTPSEDNIQLSHYNIYEVNLDPISDEYYGQLSGGASSFTITATASYFDTHAFYLKAVDFAGNTRTSNTVFVDLYDNHDNDNLDDKTELDIGTNPLYHDTDYDGLWDDFEHTYGLDPNSATGDDGYTGDPDNDGLYNFEERDEGTHPRNADTDGDLLDDGREVNGWYITVEYTQNIVETYHVYSDPLVTDTDGDGLDDRGEYDHHANPTVSDTDSDSNPDLWEVTYSFDPSYYPDRNNDPDNDGLRNYQEENLGTHPRDSDSDDDGMPDGWENTYSLDPLDYYDRYDDPDGDYRNNLQEYQDGTNPNVSDSPFTVSSTSIGKNSYGYIAYSFNFHSFFAGTIYIKLYRVGCSTCTSGTLVKSTTKSIGTGSGSYSTTYNPSVTGYYRFKVKFVSSSGSTYYDSWISGYAYHYESSGGGGGGGGYM